MNHQKIQKEFYNKTFEKKNSWSDENFSKNSRFFIERFIDSAIYTGAKNILEIGCGNGMLTFFLLKKKLRITAIDISEKAIENIKYQFSDQIKQGKINAECIDIIEFLKTTDQKFDSIVGSGIIHHIEKKDWEQFFHLVYERLNPGGIFACGPEPNAGGLYSLAWRSARFFYKLFGMDYDWEVEKGTLDMVPKNLKHVMKQAGFSVLEIEPFQLIPHFHQKFLEYIDKKLISYIPGRFSFYIIIRGKK